MYRTAIRATPRITSSLRSAASRRFASTVPADKSRSWKSSAARWGLAGAVLYYYNTSTAFAEEPVLATVPAPAHFSDDDMTTVDAIVAQKRKEAEARQLKAASEAPAKTSVPATTTQDNAAAPSTPPPAEGSPEALEQEAGQQGAFNPETGEINWDCPCLGGMADGPCGEDFKAAFSCFVYSTEEPKGMDCIDKFQNMQDCFRKHPEIYGEELADDEEAAPVEDEAAPAPATRTNATAESSNAADKVSEKESAPVAASPKKTADTESTKPIEKKSAPKVEEKPKKAESTPKENKSKPSSAAASPAPIELPASEFQSESNEAKPDPRFDATAANAKVQN